MFSLSLTAFKTGAKPSVDARTSPTHSPGAPFSGAGGSSSLLLLCLLSVNICSTVQTQTNPNPSPLMFSARSRPKVWFFMKVNWRFGERRSIGRGASVALVEAEEWPAFVSGGKCWKFEREETRWAEEGLERHFERRCEEEVVQRSILLLLPQANLYFEGSSDHFQWNLSITETWAAADLWTV